MSLMAHDPWWRTLDFSPRTASLNNDQILADYHAARVLEARPVALLPTLTYGFYPAFLEYPGSTSVSHDTQRDTVVATVRLPGAGGGRR